MPLWIQEMCVGGLNMMFVNSNESVKRSKVISPNNDMDMGWIWVGSRERMETQLNFKGLWVYSLGTF
jgi:hypothetical protein